MYFCQVRVSLIGVKDLEMKPMVRESAYNGVGRDMTSDVEIGFQIAWLCHNNM